MRSTTERYGRLARRLHWGSAALILALIPIGMVMARIDEGATKTALYRAHVGVGLAVLIMTLVRVVWRFSEESPTPPPMPPWRARLFTGVHVLLYVGLFVLAISGIATLVSSGMTPFPLDVAPENIDEELASLAAHKTAGYIFVGLLVGHVAGVISYQLTKGDVMSRMGVKLPRRHKVKT